MALRLVFHCCQASFTCTTSAVWPSHKPSPAVLLNLTLLIVPFILPNQVFSSFLTPFVLLLPFDSHFQNGDHRFHRCRDVWGIFVSSIFICIFLFYVFICMLLIVTICFVLFFSFFTNKIFTRGFKLKWAEGLCCCHHHMSDSIQFEFELNLKSLKNYFKDKIKSILYSCLQPDVGGFMGWKWPLCLSLRPSLFTLII